MFIDLNDYSNRNQLSKLTFLALWIDLIPSQMARILEKPVPHMKLLLSRDTDLKDSSADMLLSVLAYLMRLSGYDTEMMERYWREIGQFKESTNPPPWDELGLCRYLEDNGLEGLQKSIVWIGSH